MDCELILFIEKTFKMRREQRPTKKDFEYIICIFEVDGTDGETYVEYKWKKASSSAIITIKEAKKYGF
ncbi:unnamed protein product [Rhizophagus irregularis]|uniref:Uncharacterized protein n=1 Tax=Rhizophagus irregularis TaxID=588596 RepID=A0A916EEV5_9GLOM|nr:unnamed protein product [Rhizophagus irregularis]